MFRRSAVLVLTSLLALVPASVASADVSRSAAAKKAIAKLGVADGTKPVVVFGTPRPVRRRTVITEAGAGTTASTSAADRAALRRAGVRIAPASTVLKAGNERAWLFYEDQAPNQAFEHPGRVVLVGVESGKVTVSRVLRWMPLIDGRQPVFFTSAAGYNDARHRVFERARSVASAAQAPSAINRPNRKRVADALAAERSCALRMTDTLGNFYDYSPVDRTRERLGHIFEDLERTNAGFVSERYTRSRGGSPLGFAKTMLDKGCRDLFLYAAGAGYKTGEAAVNIGTRARRKTAVELHDLTAAALEQFVKANPAVTFKLLMDAPYAGRVAERLRDEKNVLVLLTPGGAGDPAFTYLPGITDANGNPVRNTANPSGLLEFTNRILRGMERFLATPGEVDVALAFGASGRSPSMMAWLLGRSMGLVPDDVSIMLPGAPQGQLITSFDLGTVTNAAPVAVTGALTALEDTATALTLAATDADANPLTFTVTSPPAHGTLSGTAPDITYTPAADFNGSDSLTFQVADGRGGTASATVAVTVTPVNDPPVLKSSSSALSFTENGAPVAVDPAITLADVDDTAASSVSVSIEGHDPAKDVLSFAPAGGVTGTYDAAAGKLTLTGAGSFSDYQQHLRAVQYSNTSDAPSTSARSLKFSAGDGKASGTATRTLSIAAVNDPPVAADAARTGDEDVPLSLAFLATDPDGDTLTYTVKTGPASGALAGSGSTRTYTPDADFTGADSVVFTADDGHGGNDDGTVSITVDAVNDAPVISAPDVRSLDEDDTTDFSGPGAPSVSDVDAAGDDLELTLEADDGVLTLGQTTGLVFTTGDGTGDATMTLTGAQSAINAALDRLVYAPDADFTGSDAITLTVDDGANNGSGGAKSGTATIDLTVDPVNDAPVNAVPGAQTVDEDATKTLSGASAPSVSDRDAGAGPVKVTLAVGKGVLTLAATSGLTFSTGDGSQDATATFTGTLAAVNSALDGLIYAPEASYTGADTLTLTSNDQGNTGSGGAKTDTDTIAFMVGAFNDAPVNTVPGAQTLDEDATKTLSGAAKLSVADVDAGTDPVKVELDVDHGVLTLGATSGLSFSGGSDGTADAAMIFTGTLASINAALDGLAYAPGVNYNGADTLTMTTDDLGNTGAGGSKSDTDTVGLTVTAVNDAPVNSVPGAQTLNEDATKVLSGLSVADVDAAGDAVEVQLSVIDGTLDLAGTTGLTFTAGDGTDDRTMTFTGTLSAVNTALSGLAYVPDPNFSGADTLTVKSDDQGENGSGGAKTDTDTVALTVDAVNDAPVNSVPGAQTLDEDTTKVFSGASKLSIADADLGGDDLKVELGVTGGTLTLGGTSGLAFTTGDGTGNGTMTFTGTLSAINAALDGLTYTPDINDNGPDTLTLKSDDQGNNGSGGAKTDTDTVALTVSAVNDAPINTVPGAQTFDEDTTKTFSGANKLSIADVDAGSDTVQVELSSDFGPLTLSTTAGLSVTNDGTPSVIVSGTVAAINAALDGLTYTTQANYSGPDTLVIKTDDLGKNGSGGAKTDTDTVALTISAVNDAPVATVPGTQTVVESASKVLSGASAPSVSDVDAASLKATLTAAGHGTLTLDGSSGLTFSAGDGTGDTTMTFTGAKTAINLALDGMTFQAGTGATGDATITLALDDLGSTGSGGAKTDSESFTIQVAQLNKAPVNALAAAVSIDEDAPATFTTAGVSDPDAGSDPLEVALDVVSGRITLDGLAGLTFTRGDGTSDAGMTFTGSQSAIDAALSGMTYQPNLNFNGSDTLTLVTNDQGNNGEGGAKSDTDTSAITISAVNDAPANNYPTPQLVAEDGSLSLSAATGGRVSVSDVDAASSPLTVVLTATNGTLTAALPVGGTRTGNGTGLLTLTGTVSALNTALDPLVFAPAADYAGQASIGLETSDGGATGSGGTKTDTDSLAITVTAVNDAPTISAPDGPFETDENQPEILSGASKISVADIDAALADVRITAAATNGTATLSQLTGLTFTVGDGTGDATMTFTGSLANVNAALNGLRYDPAADFSGAGAVAVTISDLGNTGSGGAKTASDSVPITVIESNSPPVNTVPGTQTIDEDTPLTFDGAKVITVTDPDAGGDDITTTISVTYGTLLANTPAGGSRTGNGTGTLVLTGSAAAITAAIDGLDYVPMANMAGADTLQIATDDLGNNGAGGAKTDTDTVTINITSVNDAPVTTVPGAQTVDEDTDLLLDGARLISTADVDSGADDIRVTLSIGSGALTLGTTTGLTFASGANGTGAMAIEGTVTELNTALATLKYRDAANAFGSRTLTVATSDLGKSGSGGTKTDSDTVAITVTPINDAPVAANETFDGDDSAIGNTTMVVNDPTDGAPSVPLAKTVVSGDLLAGATDVETPNGLSITPGTFDTDDGGKVVIEADGDFTFHPTTTVAKQCVDTQDGFDYTVEDNDPNLPERTDTGRVTIELLNCVWYVRNNFTGTPDDQGTAQAPFNTLAQAEAKSQDNHTVFVYDGDNSTTGHDEANGYSMNAGERLIGEHEGLVVDPDRGGVLTPDTLLPAVPGAHPTLTANNADVIDLANGNEVRGVTIDPQGTGGGIFGGSGDVTGTIDDVNIVDSFGANGQQAALELNGTGHLANYAITGLAIDYKAAGIFLNGAGQVDFGATSVKTNGGRALYVFASDLATSTMTEMTATNTNSGVHLDSMAGSLTLGDGADTDVSITTSGTAIGAYNMRGTLTIAPGGDDNVTATNGPAFLWATPDPSSSFNVDLDSLSASGGTKGIDITVAGNNGSTFNAAAGTLAGHSAQAIDLEGGLGNFTYGGSIGGTAATPTDGTGGTLEVSGRTGGTVALTGTIYDRTDEGGGINITGNSGGTTTLSNASAQSKVFKTLNGDAISFTSSDGHTLNLTGGGLDIDTTGGGGVNATSSGTLSITGTTNTIDSTALASGKRGLHIADTDIAAADVTFEHVTTTGGLNGIRLANTGTAGNVAIASTGANNSGGTITNASGNAIELSGTDNFTADEMNIQNPARDGVSGTNVTNFTFTDSTIHNAGQSDADITDSALAFNTTTAANENNIDGAVTITGNTITSPYGSGVDLFNHNGTISDLTISSNTITSGVIPGAAAGTGDDDSVEDGIQVVAFGGSGFAASVVKGTVANNQITGFPDGEGIVFLGGSQGDTLGSMGTPGSATDKITISGNDADGHSAANKMLTSFITANVEGRARGHFVITGNGTSGDPMTNVAGAGIAVGGAGGDLPAGQVEFEVHVLNNFLVPNSGSGSSGIGLGTDKDTITSGAVLSDFDVNAEIANNYVNDSSGPGIRVLHRDSNDTMNLKLNNNTVDSPVQEGHGGIRVDHGSSGISSFDPTLCMQMTGNDAEAGPTDAFGDKRPGIVIFKRGTATTYDFGIVGLTPSPANAAQAESFLASGNIATLGAGFFAGKEVAVQAGNDFASCTLASF